MPFSFRRSKKIAPGVRLNLGKRGASVSMGNRGGGINIGRKGVSTRIGTPVKGVSYRSKLFGCALPAALFVLMAVIIAIVA